MILSAYDSITSNNSTLMGCLACNIIARIVVADKIQRRPFAAVALPHPTYWVGFQINLRKMAAKAIAVALAASGEFDDDTSRRLIAVALPFRPDL